MVRIKASALALVLVISPISIDAQVRDNSDPVANVVPFEPPPPNGVSTTDDSTTDDSTVFPQPPKLDSGSIKHELRGYIEGKFSHPDLYLFVDRLAAVIDAEIRNGWLLETVTIIGHADGLPNPGLQFDHSEIPVRCAGRVTSPVSDEELAILRACIVQVRLASAVSVGSPVIVWESRGEDEPDGGREGFAFRKVVVEVSLRRK